jgi:hypothetical protein
MPKGDGIYRERSTPASLKVNAYAAALTFVGISSAFLLCRLRGFARAAGTFVISADSHKRHAKVMGFAAKGQRLRR